MMGKHFWSKNMHNHDNQQHQHQHGWAWGLVHALGYRRSNSNVKKLIHPNNKYEGETNNTECNWSPETQLFSNGGYEVEKLLDQKEKSSYLSNKRSRKRSLKARIKSLISEDTKQKKQGFYLKSSLQRTYSIHHLESLDDSLGKICTDWKHPIIFFPRNEATQSVETTDQIEAVDQHESNDEDDEAKSESKDAIEIFDVNKELFLKHLQYAADKNGKFSLDAFRSNLKAKLTKSGSFPLTRKLKPSQLDNKQKEVWPFSKEEKTSKSDDNKRTHRRSSSLNESLDKYGRLFSTGSHTEEAKLNSTKSLKLTNEYGHVSKYFRRIRSVSNVDSYYSDLNFGLPIDNPSVNGDSLRSNETDCYSEEVGGLKEEEIENVNKSDLSLEVETTNYAEITQKELKDQCCTADQHIEEVQILEDLELGSSQSVELNSTLNNSDQKSFDKNKSDLYYVRQILNQSGIELSASDEPLSPRLFEEVEAYWPHEVDELTGWPDFYGCWHHMMLFHLANEVLLEVYDRSLPYYPKALSSSCHIRTFPVGNLITEEIIKRIGNLMKLKLEKNQSLDIIMDYDYTNDASWMNLQVESECTALELEDIIFNELLEEFIHS